MFESTLEAQALNARERRFGTLSAAVLAHAGIALAIIAVTALIVPPVHGPEPLPRPLVIVLPPHLDPLPEPPVRSSAPKKGTDVARPGRTLTPPEVQHDVPPATIPEPIDATPVPLPSDGSDIPGDGSQGDPNGDPLGHPGSTGDGAGGTGGDGSGEPRELTGDMLRPVLQVKVEPSYPEVARRAGLGGRVTVRAVIAEDGSVESVEVLSSTNPLFNAAAVDAVRRWRYRPALMNGRPVKIFFTVRVDFLVR